MALVVLFCNDFGRWRLSTAVHRVETGYDVAMTRNPPILKALAFPAFPDQQLYILHFSLHPWTMAAQQPELQRSVVSCFIFSAHAIPSVALFRRSDKVRTYRWVLSTHLLRNMD